MTKASEKKKIRARLNLKLLDEQTTYVQKENTAKARAYQESQAALLEEVKAAGQTNDPAFILSIEKDILKNELRMYGNSPAMISSLDTAIQDITAAEELIDVVKDPVAYKAVDKSHNRPRSRIRGVPRDEARKSISSQDTRLLNMDKSRLTETEKKTIKARRNNLHRAEKAYTALQHKALGIAPPGQSRERGLER